MVEEEKKTYKCRPLIRDSCINKIVRDNLGDYFDYPLCEACQEADTEMDGEIYRLDDGRYT
jgi:hypothetical protein